MKNCDDKRLCNPNLAPELFTNTLSIRIRTYIQIGPINQWHKRFKHRVNSCGMEKSLNGPSDCPHIVGCLTCAKSTSATGCVLNRRCHTNLTSNWRLVRNKSCLRMSNTGIQGSLMSRMLSLFFDLVRISNASEHVATIWSGMPGIVHML
jgi:hypothetical protein